MNKVLSLGVALLVIGATSCDENEIAEEKDECTQLVWFEDADLDGKGNPKVSIKACERPDGYVNNSSDENDQCDMALSVFYKDEDGDGLGDPHSSLETCIAPEGYVSNSDDPDDNCLVTPSTFYLDSDGDGLGDPLNSLVACTTPEGYVNNANDDNDSGVVIPETCENENSSDRMKIVPKGTFNSNPTGYVEYLPCGYDKDGEGSYLMIFLHGLGENGNGSAEKLQQKILVNGPPKLIANDAWPPQSDAVPQVPDLAIVLSPQFDPNGYPGNYGCPTPDFVHNFLTFALNNYNVDEDHIYLTGLSCGVWGIRDYIQQYLNTTPVDAILGISGNYDIWGDQNYYCNQLSTIPVWLIHGDADGGSTPPSGSINPITKMLDCENPNTDNARLTLLPGVGHNGNAWNKTYSLENAPFLKSEEGVGIYEWLYSKTGD